MSIKQKLEESLKAALIAKDDMRKQTIRMVNSSIKNVEIDKGKQLTDNEIIAVLQKEVKIRQEAVQDAQNASRSDLAEKNTKEIAILKEFLPQQLSDEEILHFANEAIKEVGAVNAADMGKVMKILLPRLEGKAAGNQVSQIVKQLLSETK